MQSCMHWLPSTVISHLKFRSLADCCAVKLQIQCSLILCTSWSPEAIRWCGLLFVAPASLRGTTRTSTLCSLVVTLVQSWLEPWSATSMAGGTYGGTVYRQSFCSSHTACLLIVCVCENHLVVQLLQPQDLGQLLISDLKSSASLALGNQLQFDRSAFVLLALSSFALHCCHGAFCSDYATCSLLYAWFLHASRYQQGLHCSICCPTIN